MPTNTSWSTWSPIKLQGEPDGLIRWRQRPGSHIYAHDPFYRTKIDCNPDQVGSSTVAETKSFTASANIDVSTTFGGQLGASGGGIVNTVTHSLSTRVGVTIGATHNVEVRETVYGERCRSVQYEYFADYNVFDVEVIPPDAPNIGKTSFAVWEPVGWWKQKRYVPPTCCSRTTGELGMRLDDKREEVGGEARYALDEAHRELIVARGHLSSADLFVESLTAYGRAVDALEAVRRLGGEVEDVLDAVFDTVEGLVAPALADLGDQTLLPAGDSSTMSEVFAHASTAHERLSAARSIRFDDPVEAIERYAAAYEQVEAALARVEDGVHDIDELPESTGGFTDSEVPDFAEETAMEDRSSNGADPNDDTDASE